GGGDEIQLGRGLAPLLREIAAGAQLASNFDEMILRAFECWLDGVLLGVSSAESGTQQSVNAFGVRLHGGGVAGDDAPADAPSGDEVVFRHTAEGDARDVGRDRREGGVQRVFKNELVVDLIGEDN